MTVLLSILDLAPIAPGESVAQSFANSVALAQTAERSGYTRVWYAEHHNMPTIASSAPSVLIGHVASQTSTIRLGAGGIMLPNHAPLTIAEQFGTLASLHPGSADSFPEDVLELQAYLCGESRIAGVQAVPGAVDVPLYILGSSMFGAQLAAAYGLPYAFASHFAPDLLHDAVAFYRSEFTPSAQLAAPHVIAGINVVAAESSEDAQGQFAVTRRARVRSLISRGPAAPEYTDEQIDIFLTTPNGRQIANMMRYAAVGDPAEVRAGLDAFAAEAQADELILAHQSPTVADRLRSVELAAGALVAA